MPAERVREQPVSIRRFDVAGQDSGEVPEFVRHVGLAIRDHKAVTQASAAVQLVHMGPPMTRDGNDNARIIHTVGTAQLTADELLQIGVFVDELSPEREAEAARHEPQFVVRPHAVPPDSQFPSWRFSCAGFTIEAYREAGIDLLVTDDATLPSASLEKLMAAYPDQANALQNERLRSRYGLKGHGPWPVVLAGYVINSLVRDASTIRTSPYVAREGDEYFPQRNTAAPAEADKSSGVSEE